MSDVGTAVDDKLSAQKRTEFADCAERRSRKKENFIFKTFKCGNVAKFNKRNGTYKKVKLFNIFRSLIVLEVSEKLQKSRLFVIFLNELEKNDFIFLSVSWFK